MYKTRLLCLYCASTIASAVLSAQGPTVVYHFDEFGNGSGMGPGGTLNLPGALAFDPGPGGLASALSYSGLGNPPSLVAGDVLVFEPGVGNLLSDVIRFNPAGTGGNPAYRPTLVFYSNNTGGVPPNAPADTGFPIAFYANTVNVREIPGSGDTTLINYTPLAGQPGFVNGFAVTYNLVSDVPEPASAAFALIGIALLAIRFRPGLRRRRPIL